MIEQKSLLSKERLAWNSNFDDCRFLVIAHFSEVKKKLEKILNLELFPFDRSIITSLRKLSDSELIRIVASPNIAEILYVVEEEKKISEKNMTSLMNQLEDYIYAELRIHQRCDIDKDIVWTSLGEKIVDINGILSAESLKTNRGHFLDFDGYLHNLNGKKNRSYSFQEALRFKRRIDSAMDIIADISPNAIQLIELFTMYIHLRKDGSTRLTNSSSHIGIGKIQSKNFHLIENSVEEIIDFLIHESMHGYLHLIEEFEGCFHENSIYDQEWVDEKTVKSLWTGNQVNLMSYTHATLVWFGLSKFWKRVEEYEGQFTNLINREQASEFRKSSELGFKLGNSVFEHIGNKVEFIKPEFVKFVEMCQKEVLA